MHQYCSKKKKNIRHEKLLIPAAVLAHIYSHVALCHSPTTVLVTKIFGNHSILNFAPAASESFQLKLIKCLLNISLMISITVE